ncbi:MAG: hypothetical protein M3Y71_08655, partial [Actinomycetota bacterium]|nr:hypothetical protein [Actinomycetota bacterium]
MARSGRRRRNADLRGRRQLWSRRGAAAGGSPDHEPADDAAGPDRLTLTAAVRKAHDIDPDAGGLDLPDERVSHPAPDLAARHAPRPR